VVPWKELLFILWERSGEVMVLEFSEKIVALNWSHDPIQTHSIS